MSWSSLNRFNKSDPYMLRNISNNVDVESWYNLSSAVRAVNILNNHAVNPIYENRPPHYVIIEVSTGEQVQHPDIEHEVMMS